MPLVDPAAKGGLLGVFRHRYLLRLLVKREVTARYTGSFLGMLWSYINPLTQFLMYFFVFGSSWAAARSEHFAIHLFAGMVVVHFFTETVQRRHPVDRAQQVAGAEDADAAGDLPGRLDAGLALPPCPQLVILVGRLPAPRARRPTRSGCSAARARLR